MIQTRPKKLTFEEYLVYEDDTDNRYELIEGELVPLLPESVLNSSLASYLLFVLASAGVSVPLIHSHSCEIQVPVFQPKDAANRYPDLVVLREEHWNLTQRRLTITIDMPPPSLVVEIVSPGRINQERDYTSKRAQYAARLIPEYWIINPQEQGVMVLNLDVNLSQYIEVAFGGNDCIVSPTFPDLKLTPQALFRGAKLC